MLTGFLSQRNTNRDWGCGGIRPRANRGDSRCVYPQAHVSSGHHSGGRGEGLPENSLKHSLPYKGKGPWEERIKGEETRQRGLKKRTLKWARSRGGRNTLGTARVLPTISPHSLTCQQHLPVVTVNTEKAPTVHRALYSSSAMTLPIGRGGSKAQRDK